MPKLKKKLTLKERLKLKKKSEPKGKPGPKPGSRKKPGPKPGSRKKLQTKSTTKHKGPGRPSTKKPIVGFEISSKDQNRIESDFSDLQKTFDTIGDHVAKFAFEADPKSAMEAVREIVSLQKGVRSFCRTVRIVKKNVKPKYGEIQA